MFGFVVLNKIMRNTNGGFVVAIEFDEELYCNV